MNRDDIIRMAREAGIEVNKDLDDWSVPVWHLGVEYLERFAALVEQGSKERLAQAIEQLPFGDTAQSFATYVREFK